jgi:hypothetical protein
MAFKIFICPIGFGAAHHKSQGLFTREDKLNGKTATG